MREAFGKFDKDGDGFITGEEIRTVFKDSGVELDDDEINELLEEADENGDGVISFEGIHCKQLDHIMQTFASHSTLKQNASYKCFGDRSLKQCKIFFNKVIFAYMVYHNSVIFK